MGEGQEKSAKRRRVSSRLNFEDIKGDSARCDDEMFLCSGCGRVFDGGGKEVDIGGSVVRYCRLCYRKRFM